MPSQFENYLIYALEFVTIYVSVFYILLLLSRKREILKEKQPVGKLPRVSFIIPAYNEEKNIAKTMGSVLDLDYPKDKLQVIVVNDGSTDGTSQVARRYAAQRRAGERIVILDKPNGGRASAKNAGLRVAKGEFVATLDGDSFVERDGLRKMIAEFNDPNVAAASSVMRVAKPKSLLERLQAIEYIAAGSFLRLILAPVDCVTILPGPFSIYRRRVFEELGGFDEGNLTEDQEMALRMQRFHYKISSSRDAFVYTVPPKTLPALVKQRVRWNTGIVANLFKYRHLMGFSYGDLGFFVMPAALVTVGYMLAVMLISVKALLTEFSLSSFAATAQYPSLLFLGHSIILPLTIVIVSALWVSLAFTYIKPARSDAGVGSILFYLFAYFPLTIMFWLATFASAVFRVKIR
jgi:cellulose synthase/poly-beta-1,6-N-acetylglucosamine synthase-like glycosyltransferase